MTPTPNQEGSEKVILLPCHSCGGKAVEITTDGLLVACGTYGCWMGLNAVRRTDWNTRTLKLPEKKKCRYGELCGPNGDCENCGWNACLEATKKMNGV